MKSPLFLPMFLVSLVACSPDSDLVDVRQTQGFVQPSGPFSIGRSVGHLVDSSRTDSLAGGGERTIGLSYWYPAKSTVGVAGRYIKSRSVLASLSEDEFYGLTLSEVAAFDTVRVAAVDEAPATSEAVVGTILFSHGMGVPSDVYAGIYQELASRGYLVVVVDHPHGGLAEIAGELSSFADHTDFEDTPEWSALLEQEWGEDLVAVVTALSVGAVRLPDGIELADQPPFLAGHSLGGAAAVSACGTVGLAAGCVSLDGLNLGRVSESGVMAPTLLVKAVPDYSDEDLAARGRTREEWDAMAGGVMPAFVAPLRSSSMPGFAANLTGTGHLSFSDAPFLFPGAITIFPGTYLTPQRTLELTVRLLTSFMESVSRGEINQFEEVASGIQELSIQSVEAADDP